jgi:hypothetical protein
MLNVSCYDNQWPKIIIIIIILNQIFQAISILLVINVSCIGYKKGFLLFYPPHHPNFFWWSQIGDHPQEGLARFWLQTIYEGTNF